MNQPRFLHRLEHLLVVCAAAVVVRLPERGAAALGTAFGWLAGSLFRIRRGVVQENLARAFPERSAGWRRRVASATYRHFGREAVSLLLFEHMRPAEVRARCEVEGLELISEPLRRGQGVLLLPGHFGNWEISGVSLTARGIPVDAVTRRQANPLVEVYMTRARRRLGMGVVHQSDAARGVVKGLRDSKVVALVADQNAARNGVFVDFFHFPASTARGPGIFAARTGVPVIFVDPRRLRGSKARYRVRFTQVTFEPADDLKESVRRLAGAYITSLEEVIRESPEQYFWFHKRWKTRPEVHELASPRQVTHAAREGPAIQVEQLPGDTD